MALSRKAFVTLWVYAFLPVIRFFLLWPVSDRANDRSGQIIGRQINQRFYLAPLNLNQAAQWVIPKEQLSRVGISHLDPDVCRRCPVIHHLFP